MHAPRSLVLRHFYAQVSLLCSLFAEALPNLTPILPNLVTWEFHIVLQGLDGYYPLKTKNCD